MAEAQRKPLAWIGLRGRDGSASSDLEIPMTRAREVINCDFYRAAFARKRGGSANVSTSGGSAFSGTLTSLFSFIPAALATAAQLFASDSAFLFKRLAAGTSWADVTMKDAQNVAGLPVWATLNGKAFVAYNSAVNRLHCYDGSTIRRVGLATPGTPASPSESAGDVTDSRDYKVAWTVQSGGVTIRRSELSQASSAVGLSSERATVTRPTAPGEGETHWELYAASTDAIYYLVATTAIATTTAEDNNPSLLEFDVAPTVGINTVPTSAKYLLSDGNRLLSAGAHESGGFNNRVWYTPVLGSSDVGDDERIPNTTTLKNWIDIDENDGGFITGLGGPLEGYPYVFKYEQICRLIPTGDVNAPYVPRFLHKGSRIGAISHQGIVMGEDEAGRPALYFWSPFSGAFRIGASGLQYCGRDNEDITVNLGAANQTVCAVYYAAKRQVWFWVATGSSDDPDTLLVFDTHRGRPDDTGEIRGGWSRYNGGLAAARCAAMFANTLGATMSRDQKPYLGRTSDTELWKGDTGTDDDGTAFKSYIDLPTRHVAGLDRKAQVGSPLVLASADDQILRATLVTDYGEIADRSDDVTFTATGTRMVGKFEGVETADAMAVQLRVGDDEARSNSWVIDAVYLPYEVREHV